MRNLCSICLLVLLAACTTKKITPPEGAALALQMGTEGPDKFENYIHSLTVYAFRLLADGSYVYDRTVAVLDSAGIAALQDGSTKGDSKLLDMQLPVGKYKLFFVGNANGKLNGSPEIGVTLPGDITITAQTTGNENVYFLGSVEVVLTGVSIPPLRVTLTRAISKLILVLYEVPSEIKSVRLSLGNISSSIGIDGSLSGQAVNVQQTFGLDSIGVFEKDTVVCQILSMPTISDSSPFNLTFQTYHGQEKTKEMQPLVFLPNKYIHVTAIINDDPGAFLSFDVVVHYLIFDFLQDIQLPDFPLTPYR